MQNSIKRFPEVCELIGVSRTTIHRWMKNGTFPRPIQLSPHTVGWLQSDLDEWFYERINESKKQGEVV